MECVLAIDLGGSKVEGALVDAAGKVVGGSRGRAITGPSTTPTTLRRAITDSVEPAMASRGHTNAQIVGVGIGSPGPIAFEDGTISVGNLPGLGDSFPLVSLIRSLLDLDVGIVLGHDGACAALGESWVGGAKEARTVLGVTVSTGVGAGIVHKGRVFGGATGNAGHLGQLAVGPDAVWLESVASGPASVRWAQQQGWLGETGNELGRDARRGDSIAVAAAKRSAEALGTALASVAVILDFDVAVIGGGFSRCIDDYVEIAGCAFLDAAPLDFVRRARLVSPALGDDGALVGAAALVWT